MLILDPRFLILRYVRIYTIYWYICRLNVIGEDTKKMICLIINRKSLEEEEEGSIGDSLFERLQQQAGEEFCSFCLLRVFTAYILVIGLSSRKIE